MTRRASFGAHPRWRGEDRVCTAVQPPTPGSSPLARGGPWGATSGTATWGLIPAGAGRTPAWTSLGPESSAHPRWRGEDERFPRQGGPWPGSSPLARGGLGRRRQDAGVPRLIPAGAGRTRRGCGRRPCTRAHPRWRGEDQHHLKIGADGAGSSPLARGGRDLHDLVPVTRGLIPAGAGRTPSPGRPPRSRGAHPRWRGEDSLRSALAKPINGSSPLARGGHLRVRVVAVVDRLIPAGAGRTRADHSPSP